MYMFFSSSKQGNLAWNIRRVQGRATDCHHGPIRGRKKHTAQHPSRIHVSEDSSGFPFDDVVFFFFTLKINKLYRPR